MEPIALRPRKATEIIDAAIEVYRRNPIHFLLLAAMVRVPWLIVQIVFLAGRETEEDAFIRAMGIGLATGVTTLILGGFIVHMASEIYLGRETDAFMTVRKMAGRIPAIFTAALLQGVLVGFGLMLLLFPAVWFSAVLFAVMPLVVIERLSPFKAFDRSSDLSKGVKTHVLRALGLTALIWVIVKVGMLMLAAVIPDSAPAFRYVVVTIGDVVLDPLFGIATTLLYYDVRIRKEGFDIELMASQAPSVAVG